MHSGILKTELQSFGLRIPSNRRGRKGGAGPAEGGTVLFGNACAMVPLHSDYVKRSPYVVKESGTNALLLKGSEEVCNIASVLTPKFYACTTEDGTPSKIHPGNN